MAATIILNFKKNVKISGLAGDICTKFSRKLHQSHAEMFT